MTANEFRRLALELPGAIESEHMDHPDFRIAGKVFASLGYPREGWGMVKLTPDAQREFMEVAPKAFEPCAGAWGQGGATSVNLVAVDKAVVRSALQSALENVAVARNRRAKVEPVKSVRAKVKSGRAVIIAFAWITALCVHDSATVYGANVPLPRSIPETEGVSSEGVLDYVRAADREVKTMHSFMLLRHGKVIAEGWWKPEGPDKAHVLHSLSKSFTSTAVGLAVSEGKLSIDDPVLKFFPEEVPADPPNNLKAMRVRDLLTMTCGHQAEVKFKDDEPWVKSFLAHPVPHKPGTHFQYNSPGTYMLSSIVTKVTGEAVVDYLKPRLFEPLGIDDPEWGSSPQGNTLGGWGLKLRTEDIAKFGQLYLQKGRWNGKQLVPESWVEQATSKQVSNGSDPAKDWDQGYGFQFWRCRHGAFRGDGANGQFCVVLPELDAVVAITADTRDMQAELNVVWDKLLPAFQADPLPPNSDAEGKLKRFLGSLEAGKPQ